MVSVRLDIARWRRSVVGLRLPSITGIISVRWTDGSNGTSAEIRDRVKGRALLEESASLLDRHSYLVEHRRHGTRQRLQRNPVAVRSTWFDGLSPRSTCYQNGQAYRSQHRSRPSAQLDLECGSLAGPAASSLILE